MAEQLNVMELKQSRRGIGRQMVTIGIVTALLLMIPLVAMQFTKEVNWTAFDFLVMGALLFGTGLAFVLVARQMNHKAYRAGVGVGVAAGLLLIWINGAVGIIGSENNPAHLLYGGVLAVGLIGAALSRFRARGMMWALFATALAQFLVPVVALIIWRPSLDDPPGMMGVFVLNAFFAGLFAAAGLLFRRAGVAPPNQN
jgi:hypothetical protein